MVIGIKKIVVKMTVGDEYGVYFQTQDNFEYLLFAVTTYNDLVQRGKDMAKYFGVKFDNRAPSPKDPEAEEKKEQEGSLNSKSSEEVPTEEPKTSKEYAEGLTNLAMELTKKSEDPWIQPMLDNQNQKNKPRRVSGVAKKVKPLIAEGKTDEEIFSIMLPDYVAVGRTEKEAQWLLLPYLKDIREGKY